MALEHQLIQRGATGERIATPRTGVIFHNTTLDMVQPYGAAWETEFNRGKADSAVTIVSGDTAATATDLGTGHTFPANTLIAGRSIRVVAFGLVTTHSVAPGLKLDIVADDTSTVTVLCTTTATVMPVSLVDRMWHIDGAVTCITTGAPGTVEAQGIWTKFSGAATAVSHEMRNTAVVSLSTEAEQTIRLQATWTAGADANSSVEVRSLQVFWMGGV